MSQRSSGDYIKYVRDRTLLTTFEQNRKTPTSPYSLPTSTNYITLLNAINSQPQIVAIITNGPNNSPTIQEITNTLTSITVTFLPPINGPVLNYTYSVFNASTGERVASNSLSPTDNTFTVQNLQPGETFNISLTATIGTNISPPDSATASTTTAPDPPTDLTIEEKNQQLVLSYTPPTNTGGLPLLDYTYTISPPPRSIWKGLPRSTQQTYTISGLENGTEYTIIYYANNAKGRSTGVTIKGTPSTVPGQPTLTATKGDGSFSATISNMDDGGSDLTKFIYKVTYMDSGTEMTQVDETDLLLTESSFTVNGLTNGQLYKVYLWAVNKNGSSTIPEEDLVTPSTVPGPPTVESVVVESEALTFTFSAPTSTGGFGIPITGYSYTLKQGASDISAGITTTLTPIQFTELTNALTYTFSIVATNENGDSSPGTLTGIPATVPGAPTIASIGEQNEGLVVTFEGPTFNGGSDILSYSYEVYDNTGSQIGSGTVSNTSTSISIPESGASYTLTNGDEYTVKLYATNSKGDSNPAVSDPVSPGTYPTPPTIVSSIVDSTNSTLTVSFTAPTNTGGRPITGYVYSINNVEQTSELAADATELVLNNLTAGDSYTVVLKTRTTFGLSQSGATTTVTFATVPQPPENIVVVDTDDNKLYVTYDAPTDNGGSPVTSYPYQVVDSNGTTIEDGTVINTHFTTTTSLTLGATYTVNVYALNIIGPSASPVTATITISTTPTAPTITSVSELDTQLSVNYNEPTSDGGADITDYKYILRNMTTETDNSEISAGTSNPTDITGLTNETPYRITFRAVNRKGPGASTLYYSMPTAADTLYPPRIATVFFTGEYKVGYAVNAPNNFNGQTQTTNYFPRMNIQFYNNPPDTTYSLYVRGFAPTFSVAEQSYNYALATGSNPYYGPYEVASNTTISNPKTYKIMSTDVTGNILESPADGFDINRDTGSQLHRGSGEWYLLSGMYRINVIYITAVATRTINGTEVKKYSGTKLTNITNNLTNGVSIISGIDGPYANQWRASDISYIQGGDIP